MNLGHDRPRWCRSFPGETSQASFLQPEEGKWGQLRGDNENCLGMCVCAWWALFMKLYCTNDPKQPCSSLTTKIHHKLCKVVQSFFFLFGADSQQSGAAQTLWEELLQQQLLPKQPIRRKCHSNRPRHPLCSSHVVVPTLDQFKCLEGIKVKLEFGC